jgi:hypothetical protein
LSKLPNLTAHPNNIAFSDHDPGFEIVIHWSHVEAATQSVNILVFEMFWQAEQRKRGS